MKITIYENRDYKKSYFQNEGTKYENKATTLLFDLPETIEGRDTSELNKYIVFDIDGEENKDILKSDNTFTIPNSITELGKVKFNLYLVESSENQESENLFQWISKEITFNFNKAAEAKEVLVPQQKIDIFNSLVSELNDKIAEVELIESDFEIAISKVENLDIDVSKEGKTTTIEITKKDGTTKTENVLDGYSLDYNWENTSLGVKREDEENYNYVDLKGEKGDDYVITPEDYQEIADIVESQIHILETDPVFSASASAEITSTDIKNWNNKSEFSGNYNDLSNKPAIPSEVTESTVSGWGFTKNTGTITGITMNGSSKGTSGVVDLETVITSHQDISGKLNTSKVKNANSTTAGDVYDVRYINSMIGNIESLLAEV